MTTEGLQATWAGGGGAGHVLFKQAPHTLSP